MLLDRLLVFSISILHLVTSAEISTHIGHLPHRNALGVAAQQQIALNASSERTARDDDCLEADKRDLNDHATESSTPIVATHKQERDVAYHHSGSEESYRAHSVVNDILTGESLESSSQTEHEDLDTDEAYHMVVHMGGATAEKRQTDAAYSDGNGTVTNDCRTAPVYQIQNGSLSVFLNNVQYFYTTHSGVDVQTFLPSVDQGSIRRAFRLGSNGEVVWRNPAFDTGQAQFCSTENGTLFAVFRSSARPAGCLTTRLQLFMASSCARLPEYVSTLVQTQSLPASTVTTTVQTTNPAVTIAQTVVSTAPAATTTRIQTTTASPVTQTRTLPANTVTVTEVPAPSTCANQGVEYGVFRNNPGYVNNEGLQPQFMKSPGAGGTWNTLYTTGITDGIGGFPQVCGPDPISNITIYRNPQSFSCTEFSVMHRFYLYPPVTGTYRFFWEPNDDRSWLWVGDNARQGWTGANANQQTGYLAASQPFDVPLQAGAYYPMRVAFTQGGGGANWGLNVTDPLGRVAWDRNTVASPYIVRRSCDNFTAPSFQNAFGQEV
ncbi:hypothetical protein BST61_g5673 [Cercospora zeina]